MQWKQLFKILRSAVASAAHLGFFAESTSEGKIHDRNKRSKWTLHSDFYNNKQRSESKLWSITDNNRPNTTQDTHTKLSSKRLSLFSFLFFSFFLFPKADRTTGFQKA
jgi:hypothetical protein